MNRVQLRWRMFTLPVTPPVSPGILRNRRHRASRALGTGLMVFVILNLALSAAMETVRPEWRDPEYGHRLRQIRKLQATAPHRPLVLAIGSSRTQMGLSPSDMEIPDEGPRVFNLGHSGFGPIHQAMMLRRALAAGVKPGAVLIEYMPAAFQEYGSVQELMAPILPALSLADITSVSPYCESTDPLLQGWARVRLNPFSAMRITLLSHIQPGWLPVMLRQDYRWTMVDPLGWAPYPYRTVTAEAREAARERMRGDYYQALQHLTIGHWQEQAFRDMIAACQSAGIPVAIYTMPESPTFRGWYSPETASRSQSLLDRLTRETGVPVFDSTSGFEEEDFADGHHMLQHAARAFSQRLWKEYLQEWLGRK